MEKINILNFLIVIFSILSIGSVIYYIYSLYATVVFFKQKQEIDPDFSPPLTILKPLCGLDWESYTALTSFCQQDYPLYQIIFSVQDFQDPSIGIVQKIQQDFPDLDIELVIGDRETALGDRILGINPKINNLANGATKAKYPILVLSDSDIQVEKDYLKTIIQPFADPLVGVVTCLYNSLTEGWLAGFEALDITSQFCPKVLTARQLEGVKFAFGATIAIRQETLDKIGGFASVADYLADDYQLGYLPSQNGYKVILSSYLVEHRLGNVTFNTFLHRQIRWFKCIRVERFWGYVGLIFTYGIINSFILLLLTQNSLFGWSIFGLVWNIRFLTAYLITIKYLKDYNAKEFFLLIPLRDFVSFGIWCYSFIGNQVIWRDKTYQLLPNGQLSQL
ncbi:MAG: bacteriohopanetetrol glucosamine biosynthesis glycosyltransferase HpnI [Snowella sp.]|nr:bacteriohopanetetrol glucosamine biosynthesis glycosyltransferase HpnI [Snowella sp.]